MADDFHYEERLRGRAGRIPIMAMYSFTVVVHFFRFPVFECHQDYRGPLAWREITEEEVTRTVRGRQGWEDETRERNRHYYTSCVALFLYFTILNYGDVID